MRAARHLDPAELQELAEAQRPHLELHVAPGQQGSELPREERGRGTGEEHLDVFGLGARAHPTLPLGDALDLVEEQGRAALRVHAFAVGPVQLVQQPQPERGLEGRVLQVHVEHRLPRPPARLERIDDLEEQCRLAGSARADERHDVAGVEEGLKPLGQGAALSGREAGRAPAVPAGEYVEHGRTLSLI